MPDQPLPKFINPLRLAEKRATLKGALLLADMPRLKECLADPRGEVSVSLDFSQDETQRIFVHLKANADLILQCQRCMENFHFPVSIDILLRFVKEEITPSDKENYELFLMKEELVVLRDMVEDEILLSLPIIAKHPQDECSVVLLPSHEAPAESPFKSLLKIALDRNKKH